MPRIADLKAKAIVTQRLHEQKTDRIRAAVNEVVNSSAFHLQTAMVPVDGDSNTTNEFAANVATAVASVVTDPVNDFIDICRARGMSQQQIDDAVTTVNNVFILASKSDGRDIVLKAVAAYMRDNPNLYDAIAAFQVNE